MERSWVHLNINTKHTPADDPFTFTSLINLQSQKLNMWFVNATVCDIQIITSVSVKACKLSATILMTHVLH